MHYRLLLFCLLSISLSSCLYDPFPRTGGGSTGGSTGSRYPNDGQGGYPNGDGTYSQPPATGPAQPADRGVRVDNIRLTRDYTILDLTFTDANRPAYDENRRQIPSGVSIEFDPAGRLVAANGARTFAFVKADNIPLKPKQIKTYGGRSYSFTLYFERLDKGLENFDLFECNDYDQIVCWNIYNLYVRNPASPVVNQPLPPAPPPPSRLPGETPLPAPAPKPVEPPAVQTVMISGVVSNSLTNRPITATVAYQLSNKSTPVDSVQSFASDGSYRMQLLRSQVYTYVASAKGYLPASGTIDLMKASNNQKITRNVQLKPLTVGTKITLQNIYFAMSKSDLLPASFAELDRLVTLMNDNPQARIRLEGHTDIIGDKEANLQLSRDRVLACQRYLVGKRIDVDRIETVGYGDTRPILTKGTDEERKVNRRVEFVILAL
ncbi:OmpA family protein [Fibrella aquatilis]|uniref:OmpA family protein n=1 Tax=Fibrella aquatilis TaxID=2817059 RepID=A0A939K1L3_9BACT|nr:OmpA family protein [Fibrella aquatilis]MBO0933638.1 OmpA family protein [Fibrella aquatilis]